MKRNRTNPFLILVFLPFLLSWEMKGQSSLVLHAAPAQNRISENASRCMLQDSKGYIWIGTIDGLNRYDGYRFQVYQFDLLDSSSISGNYITHLLEDSYGHLWVGTNNGLNRYDRDRDCFVRYLPSDKPNALPDQYITGILADDKKQLWVATYKGLCRFNYADHTFYPVVLQSSSAESKTGLAQEVNALAKSRKGFWVSYDKGKLAYYQNGTFADLRADGPGEQINTLYEDRQGILWMGTESGVFRLQPRSGSLKKVLNKSSWSILEIEGKLWVNVKLDGIYEWNTRRKRLEPVSVFVDGQPCYGDIKAFFKDREGILWTTYHGLFKQDPYEKRFQCFREEKGNPKGPSGPFVTSLGVDRKDRLVLLSSGNGLNLQEGQLGRWRNFLNDPLFDNGLIGQRTIAMAVSGDSVVILGPQTVFLFLPESGTLKSFPTPGARHTSSNASIVPASNGEYWIGGGRILRLNLSTGKIQDFTPSDAFFSEEGFRLYQDTQQQLWAISGSWIYSFKQKENRFQKAYQLEEVDQGVQNYVVVFLRDSSGNFWIGRRNGLECFNPGSGKLRRFTTAEGLPNNCINSILIDHRGLLWIATNNGLSRLSPQSGQFRNFDRLDGLQDEIFLPNSALKLADGRLLFGGVNGFNIFHPDSLAQDNPHPPRVWITDLKVLNKTIVPGPGSLLSRHISDSRSLRLSHKHSSVSFEFLALGYSQPEKNQYAYRMAGVDPEWNYVGTRHSASYSGLPRGRELFFQVKAANHDGVWNEQPTVLKIYVQPPFWETWWFRVALLVALLALLLLYYRWRIRTVKMRNEWLEREVWEQTAEIKQQAQYLEQANEELKQQASIIQEQIQQLDQLNKAQSQFFTGLSHEFRTPLTLLIGSLEELEQLQGGQQVKDIRGRMQQTSQHLLELVNQLMDSARLESGHYKLKVSRGDLREIVRRIISSFQGVVSHKEIELFLEDEELSPGFCWFDRDAVYKILNNLIANALEYTLEGSVRVQVKTEEAGRQEPVVFLSVEDTGIGIDSRHLPFIFNQFYQVDGHFPSNKKGSGIGLSLVRQLVELHKGRILVESEPGKGSRFMVWLPVGEDAFSEAEKNLKPPAENPSPNGFEGPDVAEGFFPAQRQAAKDAPLLLVAEDNPEIRGFIIRQLRHQYQFLEAETGEEALQLALTHLPDLIISDVIMPGLDGFEFCRHIKSDERTSHIPFVLLTALAEQENKLEGLQKGAEAYLSKPFSRRELLLTVENLIRLQKQLNRWFLREYTLHHFPEGLNPKDQAFLSKLNSRIEEKISDENFGVDDLLTVLGVSRTQLFRKLKSLTGMSATEYIRDYRLRKAYQLLSEGSCNVSEVIYSTGFNSRSYFYDSFKRKFGISPTQVKATT